MPSQHRPRRLVSFPRYPYPPLTSLTLHSAVFQAGGLVVVVVEIFRRNFLASMVPVIVNAVLNEHQLVIDIVACVTKGDFHRSRLGEKQRGKILAGWVTRKMRTIAQYSIRDPAGDNQISEVPEGAAIGRTMTGMTGPFKTGPGSVKGSLRGSVLNAQMQNMSIHSGVQDVLAPQHQMMNFGPPVGYSEMPAHSYPESISERAELGTGSIMEREGSDYTPTEVGAPSHFPLHVHNQGLDFDPVSASSTFSDDFHGDQLHHQQMQMQYGAPGPSKSPLPSILQPGLGNDSMSGASQSQYASQSFASSQQHSNAQLPDPQHYQQFNFSNDHDDDEEPEYGSRWGQAGGLRVANRTSTEGSSDGEWAREALAHMNYAGTSPERGR
jgi:hypothetical protein